MNTDVNDINETRKMVTVTLTPEEVAEEESGVLAQIRKEAKVPGFRPGKAPEKMIRSRYAKQLEEELRNRVVSRAHREGVADADFEIFGIVELDDDGISPETGATVRFTVDVVPPFEVPEYEGIRVETEPTEASDDEVEQMVNQILSQRAEFNPVEKAAETGDYVRCSYEGWIGDEKIADLAPDSPMYGTQKVTWEEAGAREVPGVRAVVDGLVGMSAGDEKEVTETFPDDFEPSVLAGKTATYTLKAEEVREKKLPELTDDLLQSLQVESEEELREKIRENIRNQKQQRSSGQERQQITQYLNNNVDIPLPESGVQHETETVLRDFIQRNMQQGVSREELEKNKDQLHEGASQAARDRLKSRFILSRIAEKEGVEVTQEDLSQVIMQQAMQEGQKPEALVKELRKDRSRVDEMRREILISKTVDLLLEKAERVEKTPTEGAEAAAQAADSGDNAS